MHVDVSFSYLRSAATASFDKKEFHRNCTACIFFADSHLTVYTQPAVLVLCLSTISMHPAHSAHWSFHCQHAISQCQFFVIPLSAHILHLQPIGHLDVNTQPALCKLSVSLLPAKHHVHFQHCLLTVSIDSPVNCQHSVTPLLEQASCSCT